MYRKSPDELRDGKATRTPEPQPLLHAGPGGVLALQRAAGNQAVVRLLGSRALQRDPAEAAPAPAAPEPVASTDLKVGESVPSGGEASTVGAIDKKIVRDAPEFANLVTNTNGEITFKDEESTGADAMMSQRLNDKLAVLATKVKAEWPELQLRVTEAWDESGEHSEASSHYEGRGADITVSDKDSAKLGRLARLAVDAGLDWVYFEDTKHVHVAVSK